MKVREIGMCLLIIQLPLVFGIVLHWHPKAHVLVPWMDTKGGSGAVTYTAPLALPCIAFALLLTFAGKRCLDWPNEVGDCGTVYDCTENGGVAPETRLFWLTVCIFTLTKTFLLMHYVDLYALLLATILENIALVLSCQPVDHNTMCYRVAGVTAFGFSILPVTLLALEHTSMSEAYTLALAVVANALLILGHTYDFPSCSLQTVVNCRVAYICSILILFPLSIATSCEIF